MEATGPAHEAMFLVLSYLPLYELLSMSQVCKSLKHAITTDVLIWLELLVQKPLNLRITDELLLKFTRNAQGRLQTLALLNCVNITNDGLRRVVSENPLLTKLYVPGCTSLTPEVVVEIAVTLPRLKRVYINGVYNIKQEHIQVLRYHVNETTENRKKPRFYHKYSYLNNNFDTLDESDRFVDVESCPRCQEVKLVFECPKEECRECLGCIDCIKRCEGCGKCITSTNFEEDEVGETICNCDVCLDCWFRLAPKCNQCNKPLCPRHAYEQQLTPDSGDFVCETCNIK